MTERQSVIAYLQTQKARNPADDVEHHVNEVIEYLIIQIERGAHRITEQKRTKR